MNPKLHSSEPQEWLDKAYHDLDAAQKLLTEEGFPDTIAIHCHQTAEKALKGVLLYLGVDFPFTHDLSVLIQLCTKQDGDFVHIQDAAIALSPLYEEERYPFIETEIYSNEELKIFLEQAERVYQFVQKKMSYRI